MPTVSLDSILDSHAPPALVKIDVEGAEDRVLRGAGRLLTEIRPKVIAEVPIEQAELFREVFVDYRLFDVSRPADEGWPEVEEPSWNTLAVPS